MANTSGTPTRSERLLRALGRPLVIPALALVTALLAGAVIMLLSGDNPLAAYRGLLEGALGGALAVSRTLRSATPLLLTGLSVAFAFKAGLFNIGAEGQIYLGALATAAVVRYFPSGNQAVMLLTMTAGAALAGGAWGYAAGFMKSRWNVNEVITTLMLNYIAVLWNNYWIFGKWSEAGFQMTKTFPHSAWLPRLADYAKEIPAFSGMTAHAGILFGLIAAVIVYLIIYRSKWGYKITLIGDNPKAARYAGINIAANTILIFMVSGALAGLAGMTEVSGVVHRLQERISTSYGFSGVIVAWLAKLNPFAVILVSILFGALLVASREIQPSGISFLIQGITLFLIISSDVLLKYEIKWVRPAQETAQ